MEWDWDEELGVITMVTSGITRCRETGAVYRFEQTAYRDETGAWCATRAMNGDTFSFAAEPDSPEARFLDRWFSALVPDRQRAPERTD